MFLEADIKQFKSKGISQEQVQEQINIFQTGVPFINLQCQATPGDGVLRLDANEQQKLIELYELQADLTKLKFVPASGAASRMFKSLFECMESLEKGTSDLSDEMKDFFTRLPKFAFYNDLTEALAKQSYALPELLKTQNYLPILKAVLATQGLSYGNLPKGLLKFHTHDNTVRTPFEEHLVEGAKYAQNKNGEVKLHFTVSPEYMQAFKELQEKIVPVYESSFNVKYSISFSIQKPSTDTVAVDSANQSFRNSDGSVLFRPGGHGALIHNLNELNADVLFIKNIDNVVQEKYIDSTVINKKLLAGKLIETRLLVFKLLGELDGGEVSSSRLVEIADIIERDLHYKIKQKPNYENTAEATKFLHAILNRPIRVCGVVKNTGEPGGGPFWAPNGLGDTSLQIIESSQVDMNNPEQYSVFFASTHFNPVDLVCCLNNYKGEKFDLLQYVDPATCFISHKSKDGKDLKALELPGLWNGAMANWISIFMEVPIETFNPVKTVMDLLRPSHQQ